MPFHTFRDYYNIETDSFQPLLRNDGEERNRMKSVAVLLSAYNGEKYLREQLNSILSQKGEFTLSLYIRDDGSSDGTEDILREYEEKENVTVLRGSNIGITESYFALLRAADGHDYYALSDQDDVWLPGKTEAAVRALEEAEERWRAQREASGPAQGDIPLLYGCRSNLVREDLAETGQMTQADLRGVLTCNAMIQNILLGHNQVMNRALRDRMCAEKADLSAIYAHDMWITLYAAVFGRVIFENKAYTLYRQHGHNELGFGSRAGTFRWIVVRVRRVMRGESHLVTRQLMCFYKEHGRDMKKEDRAELRRFLKERKTFAGRLRYAAGTKLYRQRKSEDFLFRILYLAGAYR